MKFGKILPLLSLGLLCVAFVAPRAKADEWNQKITFTFDEPVEIPGQVLPAGSYVFEVADSNSDSSNTTESVTDVQSPSVLAMENVPLKVQTPAGEEVTVIEVFPTR